jgi:ferredoxin-NADP reductase
VTSYDRWLQWKHGARLFDRMRTGAHEDNQLDTASLDWGDQTVLEKSLDFIAPAAADVVAMFYRELFARLPGVRQLFPADLSTQHDRLVAALFALVADGTGPARLVPALEQLGRDHRKYGVRAAQYRAVGGALLGALARCTGLRWTPDVEAAWRARYEAAATVMTHAAAENEIHPPFWYGTVAQRAACGNDVAILTVRPRTPYPYLAGQYATIESPRLPRVWRAYSMATAPRSDQLLEFHVRATGHGGLSDVLVNSVPGDVVRIGPPQGLVTLDQVAERSQLFVAGGTGWSTVKALLGERARAPWSDPSHLIIGCRPGEPYDPDFSHFVRNMANIDTTTVHNARDMCAELTPARLPGRNLDAFVSGPPGLVRVVTELLRAAGVPRTRIHHDELLLA